MSEKVCLGLLLVGLESSLEECLETCGSVGCDCCLGHDGGTDEVEDDKEDECDHWEEGAQRLMAKVSHWSDD